MKRLADSPHRNQPAAPCGTDWWPLRGFMGGVRRQNSCSNFCLAFEFMRENARANRPASSAASRQRSTTSAANARTAATAEVAKPEKTAKREATSSSTSTGAGVNVQVVVRCRPPSQKELDDTSHSSVLHIKKESREVVVTRRVQGYETRFMYDTVWGPQTTQSEFFTRTITPIVDEVLQGFNCTIFAYGQTGTGKTYTMEGDMREYENYGNNAIGGERLTSDAGVIPRAVQRIFECLDALQSEYSIRVSYLEIYNEELNDLLVDGDRQALRIYDDQQGKRGLSVDKLEEVPVTAPRVS
eukprot:GHVU01195989.1.p1 GENE.GHVU01195989.1~~GHVU01195989.1.p1  ORF type:complete len:299 (-),score=28.26 GHVU01195989.1:327-1223(-)